MRRERLLRGLGLAALAAAAALYFHGAIFSTLERTDEGQIVYASWRTAEGDVPYVDFEHIYGPSVFFVNGTLMRIFGRDLHVVRVSLVVLKMLLAVLVYLLARWVAPRGAALLVTALLVCMWGMPIWLFNTPYATYYATVLCLAGVLLAGRDGAPSRFASGLCFGVAATFKQTQGLFGFLALVLFLIHVTSARRGGAPVSRFLGWSTGVARVLALVAALGIGVGYMANHLTAWRALLLLLPFAATVGVLIARELADWPPGALALTGLGQLVVAGVGMALPLIAYAVAYARIGAFDALVYNLLAGLPQRILWYVPFPMPDWRTVWFGATVASTFAVLAAWHGGVRQGLAAALAAFAVSTTALLILAWRDFGVGAYVLGGGWTGEIVPILFCAPLLILAAAVPALAVGSAGADAAAPRRDALALLFFSASASVLLLYPGADHAHAVMVLPAFLPLVAEELARLWRRVPGAAVLACLCLAGVAWPFVRPRLALASTPAVASGTFARASGIVATDPKGEEAARLVRHLSAAGLHDRTLLVLTNEQMLYFLADVRSALPHEEFVFFLVGAELVADEVARSLVDQEAVVERLTRSRPLVVDDPASVMAARFRRVFPRVAAFIDGAYQPEATIGAYRILAPRS